MGPIINTQRSEAGDSFLASNDGDRVLSSDFHRQSRAVPSILKGEFQKLKHESLLKANMLDISGDSVGQGTRVVPVGNPFKQRAVLLREVFSSEEIRGAYQAWNFLDEALQSEGDISILKRCKAPRVDVDHLVKWYDPESEVAAQKLHDEFHDFTIPPNGNPTETFHALKDTNSRMAEKGMIIPDTFQHARFVRALRDEYGHVKATLQAMKYRDRTEITRIVGTRYSTLSQKKGSQRSSWPPEQAFFSSESGGRRGARRGRDHGRRGTQGRGRGGNSNKGGGSSSAGGTSSASSANGSSHSGGSRPHGRCWRCNRRGRIREECTTKESYFLAK